MYVMTDQAANASDDHILLKWGTLKGWNLNKKASQELVQKYANLGTSYSAMAQKDTPEQKLILCDLIQQHDGTITNDWDGNKYTKEQAIDYIMNYGKHDN
jgi:hypothetical protein